MPSCRSTVQYSSRFRKLCSSQHTCLVPGAATEPGQKTRDLRKCKPNPKLALYCVGRNQFRDNMGNFCSDPINLLLLLSLTGGRLESPHSLYCDALLIAQGGNVPMHTFETVLFS